MSGEMMEFRITSDLAVLRQQVIEANFPEVRSWLEENLAPYRSMTVSADDIPNAKTYRATIRKVRDRIDQSRKEAKAAALEAYTAFEAKCKELTGLCDDAANAIDGQIKAYETAEKEAKTAELRAAWEQGSEEAREFLPWERVYNPRWENKGYSADLAKSEIADALAKMEQHIATIRSIGEENTAYLLDYFKMTHDFAATVRKNQELIVRKEMEEQRQKEAREAEARRKAMEAREATATAPAAQPSNPTQEETPAVVPEEDLVTVTFKVVCSREKLTALGQYMKEHGIRYGRP